MPLEYIWTVSADGVPFRIPARADPRCTSEADWEEMRSSSDSPIRTVVSSPTAAFAIDRSGRVLVLVLPSHIAIRERVEIWANQVWIVRWMSPLFLDRPRFSDESGKVSKDPSLEDVEPGWSWEEPWATHLDPRKFDSDGWQYSYSFLISSWEKKCRRFHLVRRKMLKRHMRYTAHDQWVEIHDEESRMFTELAIGGSAVMEESLLFALGTDGNVFRREGIRRNRPAGSEWQMIPKIVVKGSEVDDVTLIAVSPSLATLLCVTWDGKMYHRKGISKKTPSGVTWQAVATPRNKAVICAAIGTETIWCITSDGSVWFNRIEIDEKQSEHLMETLTSEGYQLVTQGGVSRVSVSKNDQVFCITTREKIQCRTGISKNEPSGKRFESIVDRGEPKNQKWVSIDAGAVSLREIPEYFVSSSILQSRMEILHFKKANWRLKILERLQEASDRSWSVMKNVKGAELEVEDEGKGTETIRRVRCQRRVEKTSNIFKSVNVSVTPTHFEISGDADFRKSIDISAVKSVLPTLQRLPQKYLLYVYINSESESECFAFTDEKSRGNFQAILENMIREQICSSTRSSFGESMWSVSCEGVVRWHCLAEMSKESHYEKRVNLGASRALLVDGHFKSIDCGARRLVWAINQSGSLYSLSTLFDPLNAHGEHDFKMSDEVTLRLFEYQKATLFRGFQSFENTQTGGISGWMCNSRPCPAFFSSLPSSNWNWCDANWKLENEEDWKYSNELNGTYLSSDREKGKARRRIWVRRARFESNNSPWCHVEAPPIRCVRVAKMEAENGRINVLALTKDGHILSRNGVSRQNFTGDNWTQILTDFPIISIHIESHNQILWAATSDGTFISKNLKTGSSWKQLEMDLSPITRNLASSGSFELTGYSKILYARLSSCLFRIDTENETISDAYPMDNLQQTVVNAQGSICVRGTNITVIREWRVTPYIDRKATIIAMRTVERASDMGRGVQCIAFY